MKKTIYALLATVAMAAAILTGAQGAASAAPASSSTYTVTADDVSVKGWPSGCKDARYDRTSWYASCSKGNGGSWQAFVVCRPEEGGDTFTRSPSVWKYSGNSVVACPPLSYAVDGGMWTRST